MKKFIILMAIMSCTLLYAKPPMEVMQDVDTQLQAIATNAQKATTVDQVVRLLDDLTSLMSTYAYATMDLQKEIAETQTIPDSLDATMRNFAKNMQSSMIEVQKAVKKYQNHPEVKASIEKYMKQMKKLDEIMQESTPHIEE